MSLQQEAPKVPTDVGDAIRAMKRDIKAQTDVRDAFDRLSRRIEARVKEVERLRDSGQPV